MAAKHHKLALLALTDCVHAAADRKHVRIAPAECALVAQRVIAALDVRDIDALARRRPDALDIAATSVERMLDLIVVLRAACLIMHLDGDGSPDLARAMAVAEEI